MCIVSILFVDFGVREYYHWIRLEIIYNLPLKCAKELVRQSCLGFQLCMLLCLLILATFFDVFMVSRSPGRYLKTLLRPVASLSFNIGPWRATATSFSPKTTKSVISHQSSVVVSHQSSVIISHHLGGFWEASGSWGGPGRPEAALERKCSKFMVFYSI